MVSAPTPSHDHPVSAQYEGGPYMQNAMRPALYCLPPHMYSCLTMTVPTELLMMVASSQAPAIQAPPAIPALACYSSNLPTGTTAVPVTYTITVSALADGGAPPNFSSLVGGVNAQRNTLDPGV